MQKTDLPKIYPNKPSKILAITGTNGKTSTAWFVQQILQLLGQKCLYIGTLGSSCGDKKLDEIYLSEFNQNNLTTPGIFDMHKILSIAKEKLDCDIAILEASSHGIIQGRIDFLDIYAAGFTNFTQDHLDYHKTMEEYFCAKKLLFSKYVMENGWAILNSDDEKYDELRKISRCKNILTYGKNGDIKLLEIKLSQGKQKIYFEYKNEKYDFETPILGEFQVYNLFCAIGFVMTIESEIDNS